MFGYVIPNQAALDDEAKARYRTAYCGLCRRIGALHGLRGRLTLSYDLTFLDLLLSSLYEGESECIAGSGHCPIHPIRKINWRHSGPTDYCADMSVALHYYNAADKWNDDHSLLGLGFEKLLDSPAQTADSAGPTVQRHPHLPRPAGSAGSRGQRRPRRCVGLLRRTDGRAVRLQAGPLVARAAQPGLPSGQVHLPAGRLR